MKLPHVWIFSKHFHFFTCNILLTDTPQYRNQSIESVRLKHDWICEFTLSPIKISDEVIIDKRQTFVNLVNSEQKKLYV